MDYKILSARNKKFLPYIHKIIYYLFKKVFLEDFSLSIGNPKVYDKIRFDCGLIAKVDSVGINTIRIRLTGDTIIEFWSSDDDSLRISIRQKYTEESIGISSKKLFPIIENLLKRYQLKREQILKERVNYERNGNIY